MHSFIALALAVFFLQSVQASLYVVQPRSGSTCRGGEECTVQWLDNGRTPLLPSFGTALVGLYTGDQQLVQTIQPIDVSQSLSLTFTPIPEAGPNSDTYYICFTSTTSDDKAYSPFFQLDGMSGSFDSPLDSATTSIPIPPAAESESTTTNSELPTITVGTLETSRPPIPTLSATTPLTSASPTRLTTAVRSTITFPTSTSQGSASNSESTDSPSDNASSRSTPVSSVLFLGVLSLYILVASVL